MALVINNVQVRVTTDEQGKASHVVVAMAVDEESKKGKVLTGRGDTEDAAFSDLWSGLREEFSVKRVEIDANHVEIEGAPVQIDKLEGHIKL